MSSSKSTTKSFIMKTEDYCLDGGQPTIKNGKQKTMSSNDQEKAGDPLGQTSDYDMTHTICLFRKYLAKTQHDVGKSNMEESEVIKRHSSPSAPLIPNTFSCDLSRPPTLLERKLLPRMRGDREEIPKSTNAKSSKEQLTIFYAGTVNVYNNVPFDKAQAIMLLARESSTAKPLVDMTKSEATKTPLHRHNLKSFCNLQSDLPIARKRSLQHFIEKRRQRLVDRSPYYLNTKSEKPISNNENQTLSLSSFPSRLGFLSPLSTNKVVN